MVIRFGTCKVQRLNRAKVHQTDFHKHALINNRVIVKNNSQNLLLADSWPIVGRP